MKNKDKITLFIFIILIVLILGLLIFNMYKNQRVEDVDRKVEYIFENFTYDTVYSNGNELFFQAIELFTNKEIFEYELDNSNKIKYYALNDYNHYKKINNFIVVSNTLASSEVTKYMELKKIIKYENNYYIENYNEDLKNNYVGSIVDIKSYNHKYVYFESTNYYCDNYKYIGLLEDAPSCDYTSTNSTFTIVLENNNLRINNLEEIKNIIK